jgi:hypothetical protein
VVVRAAAPLLALLTALLERRVVLFAGLPGTGKSLLLHQLTLLAIARGHVVHLLQWDTARPVFEMCPAGRRYPQRGGVTHAMIRKAAGAWARAAIGEWYRAHGNQAAMLVGETPLVGNRFVELARREDDAAEAVLTHDDCRFVLPVPSPAVRAYLEAERERRAAAPLHEREREDAPPRVLRQLWREIASLAHVVDTRASGPNVDAGADPAYDPVLYEAVYRRVLRHRHVDVVRVEHVLPTRDFSPYVFPTPPAELLPAAPEAEAFIRDAEARFAHRATLEADVASWWKT